MDLLEYWRPDVDWLKAEVGLNKELSAMYRERRENERKKFLEREGGGG